MKTPRRSRVTRREFVGRAAAWLAAPYLVPATALGKALRPPPSRRTTMALIGCGGMGNGHLDGLLGRSEVEMVAVCDPDRDHREESLGKVTKAYADRSRSGTFRSCVAVNDFRDVLARDDLDAVVIATPDHWHAPIAIAAARAGKDMYCEKPLALTVLQGRAMVDAVTRHGRILQTGSWQRSIRDFRFACELVRNGRIGKVHTVTCTLIGGQENGPQKKMPVPPGFDYDLWLGPAPEAPYTRARCHFDFRWIRDYSGGGLTDWGAHHLDIAQWGLGTSHSGPVQVESKGEFPRNGLYDMPVTYEVVYTYADGVRVVARTGSQLDIRFEGDRGWIKVWREGFEASPAALLQDTIGPNEIHLHESGDHTRNFLDCVASRREPAAPVEIAHRSATLCHLGNISLLLGRTLRWDPARERFVNDAAADRLLGRPMRGPWHL